VTGTVDSFGDPNEQTHPVVERFDPDASWTPVSKDEDWTSEPPIRAIQRSIGIATWTALLFANQSDSPKTNSIQTSDRPNILPHRIRPQSTIENP
jgi:hypothetical protein